MHHVHLDETPSTQTYLKENWKNITDGDCDLLVSTSRQTQGLGRQGNQWHDFPNSLAFSFLFKANEEFTLSSLELGVLLCSFFKNQMQLKWPNDLINTKEEKCGGILCQVLEKNLLAVGIGINLEKDQAIQGKLPAGVITIDHKSDDFQESLPAEIYQYILSSRLSKDEVRKRWNENCFHFNRKVTIKDSTSQESGKFVGIGDIGEALLEKEDGSIKKVLSGSLFLD